jgi:predicted dienelactone hydrolase
VGADAGDVFGADAEVDAGPTLPERPWPVDETGPYKVGFTETYITYEAEGTDEPRHLRLAVWYPTLDTDGETAVYYNLFGRPEVSLGANVALEEPAPLLVFSHGNSSLAEQSFFMTEFFASHGWIVASPDHTGNTLRDTQGAIDLTAAVFRPQDVSAVIDHMLGLPDDDPLSGLVSEEHIALSGHSFGGFTTLASSGSGFAVDELLAECEQEPTDFCEIFNGNDAWTDLFRAGFLDERIKVAIPQTPGGYEAFRDGLADIDTPTLLFTGGMDRTLPNEEEGDPIWQAMQGSQHMRINLPKGGHFTFSNMCTLLSGIDQIDNDGCNEEFIEPEAAFDIINAYSLAFARYHLFDDQSETDLLDGSRAPYDGMEMSFKSAE